MGANVGGGGWRRRVGMRRRVAAFPLRALRASVRRAPPLAAAPRRAPARNRLRRLGRPQRRRNHGKLAGYVGPLLSRSVAQRSAGRRILGTYARARVLDAWDDVCARERPALVIGHGGPIRVILCHHFGWAREKLLCIDVSHAALYRLDLPAAGFRAASASMS